MKSQTTNRPHTLRRRLLKVFTALSLFTANGYAQDSCSSTHAYFTATSSAPNYKVYTINNLSTGSNLKYKWSFSDGTSSTSANPGTHTFPALHGNMMYLLIHDTVKNCSSVFADTLTVPCTAEFNLSQSGHSFYFTQLVPDSAHSVFNWNFGDGTSSSQKNPIHTYVNAGTYHMCLTVSSTIDTSCSDTRCIDLVITDPTICHAAFSIIRDTINPNTFILVEQSTGDNLSYFWDFGDGTTSTNPYPGPHTYTGSLTHAICLTVSNSATNCSSTHCDTAYSNNCSALFTNYKQFGFTYQFHAAQSGHTSYSWDFGDGTTSSAPNPQHTFPHTGYFKVTLTIVSGLDPNLSCSFSDYVSVNSLQYCNSYFVIGADSSTTDPYDFNIFNLSSGNNLTYLWDFGDGTTSTLSTPTHDYAGTGPYVICLTVANDSCSKTHCDTLDLSDTLHHLLPAKFHVKVIDRTVTGIKKNDIDKGNLSNYPNPFNGTTTINYSVISSSAVELDVYNVLGVKVATLEAGTKAAGSYSIEWNAQNLQEGIYLLQLKLNDQVITKKIMINK